jgi:hypothetical protein
MRRSGVCSREGRGLYSLELRAIELRGKASLLRESFEELLGVGYFAMAVFEPR